MYRRQPQETEEESELKDAVAAIRKMGPRTIKVDQTDTPVHYAALVGSTDILKELIAVGADDN